MQLTIKVRLIGLTMIGMLAMLATGAAGLVELSTMRAALNDANRGAMAIRNQLEADMMHDALRADVLAALRWTERGGTAEKLQEVRGDIREHVRLLRENMAENAAQPLGQATLDAIAQTQPKLEAYVVAAEGIIEQVARGAQEAGSGFDAFMASFHQMEQDMEAVSDRLEAEVAANKPPAMRPPPLPTG